MTEIGVLPLVVLGGGLAIGLLVAFTVARREPRRERADLELRIADLETERDEAYSKLRGAEGVSLTEADRDALELTAARILRDLDDARLELAKVPARRPEPSATAATSRTGFLTRHPAIGGALFGGGLVGLVAVLVFWAQRDARPAPAATEAATPAPMASGPPSAMDRGEAPLAPEVAAEVAALRDRISVSPDEVGLRRRLAELLLANGQFFDAFQEARQLLERAPEDAVGHYVSGVVRYTMGNPDEALQHFANARAAEPAYVPASIVEGIVRLQLGDREAAVSSWSAGLAAAGGAEPRLEHLLRLAREGKSADEILATPPPGS
jgi:tetratricopeptide (TPR) repeat protein